MGKTHLQEDFIVQEFQNNVITKGEVAMMVIGGKYTHAVLKKQKKVTLEYKTILEVASQIQP